MSSTDVEFHVGRQAATFISVTALAQVLATICIGLRIYVRSRLVKAFWLDDYVLLAAFSVFTANQGLIIAFAAKVDQEGFDQSYFLSEEIIEFWGLLYTLVLVLVRGAVALFFLKAIPKFEYRWQRITMISAFWLYAVFTIVYGFVNLFACGNPLNVADPIVTCLNADSLNELAYTSTVFNTILDWILTLIPASVVWYSQMSFRTKASISVIIGMGAASSIISVIRIPFMELGIYNTPADIQHVMTYLLLAIWENTVTIMAISLAACKPLLRKVLDTSSADESDITLQSPTTAQQYRRPMLDHSKDKAEGISETTTFEFTA